MNNIFIILSAGKGSRFKSKLPKQYTKYRGKMMVVHSVEKAIESKLFKKIILVIDKSHKLNTLDIDIENFAKKLIEFQIPKREIAKIISSLNKEKVNKIYDSIKNL